MDVEISRRKIDKSEMASRILDHMVEGVMVCTLEGKITYVNPMFERITGYSLEDAFGKTPEILKSYYHSSEFYEAIILHIAENGYWEGDICNRNKEGRLYFQRLQVFSVYDENHSLIYYTIIFRDTVEHRRLQQKLAEQEKKYKSLFENNRGISFALDLQGSITDINPQARDVLGYESGELLAHTFEPLIRKEDLVKAREACGQAMSGEAACFELGVKHRDGCVIDLTVMTAPITMEGKVTGIIGIALDITKQKAAERELAASENRYRSLLALYPEVVFVHTRDKIVYVNDCALDFIGEDSLEKIIGKSAFDFIYDPDKKKVAHHFLLDFQNGKTSGKTKEYRFVRTNGTIIKTEVNTTLIEYSGEQAVLGVIRDVTEKKRVEEKLKQKNLLLSDLSRKDGLTGIHNRRCYDESMKEIWELAVKKKEPVSLILLDIDQFKQYNDCYGHYLGDKCLKKVAEVLQESIEKTAGMAARYGGEEFAIILPGVTERAAYEKAVELRCQVENLKIPHKESETSRSVTVSVGVAGMLPGYQDKQEVLFHRADSALYASKTGGKNQVNIFSVK